MAMPLAIVLLSIAVVILLVGTSSLRARLSNSTKQLATITRSNQERVDRVAVLSHEIRTPLSLILGPVDLLLEETPGALTSTQREFLSTVRINASHLQEITEDILTQSRIDAGLFRMSAERVDLRALGLRAVNELRMLHSLQIAFDCPGMPPIVWGDPRLLLQAITNLLTNACRHSGGAMVILRIQHQTSTTMVSVHDYGVGMDLEQREQSMLRYRTTASGQGGMGLGMTITKEIVRLHGSQLHIQSTPKAGTSIMFRVVNVEAQQ